MAKQRITKKQQAKMQRTRKRALKLRGTKSAIMKRYAREAGIPHRNLRMTRLGPDDMTGIPVFDPTRVFQHALLHPSYIRLDGALPTPVRGAALMRGGVYQYRQPGTVYDADADGWIARNADTNWDDGDPMPDDDYNSDESDPSDWDLQAEAAATQRQKRIPAACNRVIAAAAKVLTRNRSPKWSGCGVDAARMATAAYEQALHGNCPSGAKLVRAALRACKRRAGSAGTFRSRMSPFIAE